MCSIELITSFDSPYTSFGGIEEYWFYQFPTEKEMIVNVLNRSKMTDKDSINYLYKIDMCVDTKLDIPDWYKECNGKVYFFSETDRHKYSTQKNINKHIEWFNLKADFIGETKTVKWH